jgi:hypothetical protein
MEGIVYVHNKSGSDGAAPQQWWMVQALPRDEAWGGCAHEVGDIHGLPAHMEVDALHEWIRAHDARPLTDEEVTVFKLAGLI